MASEISIPHSLRVTMLGSGTSTGVPQIACRCAVCTSEAPHNRRLRSSVLISLGERRVLVDTTPDFRQQALAVGLERLDAMLFTHAHADHIYGLDDVRVFNFRQQRPLPCYGSPATLAALRRAFSYVFDDGPVEGGGKPVLELRPISGPFDLWGTPVVPVPVLHGRMEVLGFRLGGFAYVTDCKVLPVAGEAVLQGVEVLILNALRERQHETHLTVEEAVAVAARVGARRTVLTHLSHEVDATAPPPLPAGVELGYDGLVLEVPAPCPAAPGGSP